jgi:excisionase family DNA binding protein
MEKLYNVSEAAEILNLSTSCIYKKAERGELEAVKIGSALRFSGENIRGFIEKCKMPKQSEAIGEMIDFSKNADCFI